MDEGLLNPRPGQVRAAQAPGFRHRLAVQPPRELVFWYFGVWWSRFAPCFVFGVSCLVKSFGRFREISRSPNTKHQTRSEATHQTRKRKC